MKSKGKANLRISYIGGGYDFPEFFDRESVTIISEGLPLCVSYNGEWESPVGCYSGLGASAARHLSYLRYYFPNAPFEKLVNVAIAMDGLQNGGWQDAIASAHEGVIKIVLYKEGWQVYPLKTELTQYRRIYRIPVVLKPKEILKNMKSRVWNFKNMRKLVHESERALLREDYIHFGNCVTETWCIKKRWHPDIANPVIAKMEGHAADCGAWGWKVCGAGGQGFFLVIGDTKCHKKFGEAFDEQSIDYQP